MADPFLLRSHTPEENFYIRHHNFEAELMRLPAAGKEREDFFWFEEVDGHDPDGVARVRLRAVQRFNGKDHFLRHQNFRLVLQPDDETPQFARDSLFRRFRGLADARDGWRSYEASNFKDHWIRHHSFHLFLNRRTAADSNFTRDATFFREVPGAPIDD